MRKRFCLFIILGALIFQPSLLEPTAEPACAEYAQQELKHDVTVTLKLIQVFVTDKQGNAITNLSKEHFTLYDNDTLQAITDFELHLLSTDKQAIEEALAATEPELARSISERMNRKFVFLFDVSRNSVAGLGRSKRAAERILEKLVEGTDEIGVLSFSEYKGLILHEYMSSDFSRVKTSIESIKEIAGKPSQSGLSLAKEAALAESGIGGGKGAAGSTPPVSSLSQRSERAVNPQGEAGMLKNYDFMAAMQDMAKYLRYIDGYKNIVFFSYGFPHQLIEMDMLFQKTYENMATDFAVSNCPVFGINTLGVRANAGGNYSMKKLADITGGQYFESVVEYDAIAEDIQTMTGNYYVLGYYIDEQMDGKYHEIKVEVDRADSQVHAQAGYFNPKPFDEFSSFEKNLHLVDLAISDWPQFQIPISFEMQALPYMEAEQTQVVFLSKIPIDRLEDIPKHKTELLTMVFDQENNTFVTSRGEVNFSEVPSENIYQYTLSSLPPGEYRCRMVLRDLKTGRGAVAASTLAIPDSPKRGLKLYAPLLMVPQKPAHFLRISPDIEKGSLKDIYPFLSGGLSPLVSPLPSGTRKLLATLRYKADNLEQSDIEIKASLQQDEKEKYALDLTLLASEDLKDCTALLFEVALPELRPGVYSLFFRATDYSSRQESNVTQKFTVSAETSDKT